MKEIKRLRFLEVTPTDKVDQYGNKTNIIKVDGDSGFYITRSGKIAGLPTGQEHEVEVETLKSKAGNDYMVVRSVPTSDFVSRGNAGSAKPAYVPKNDALIVRQVAYKGAIELIASQQAPLSNLEKMVEEHSKLINGESIQPAAETLSQDEIDWPREEENALAEAVEANQEENTEEMLNSIPF